jgi:hypothetical protein
MRFEEEVVVESVLPAVRSLIASELFQSYGLNQKEVAIHLELTQPAVSQYLNDKRADKEVKDELEDDPQIRLLIEDAAGKAARHESYAEEVSEIVRQVRSKGLLKEKFSGTEKLY